MNARMGNGTAVHITDDRSDYGGILCNKWGSTNGTWKSPKTTTDAVTCKRCLRLAAAK